MKKILAFCFTFLLMGITSVTFGHDSPTKEKHIYSHECILKANIDQTINSFEFSPEGYSGNWITSNRFILKSKSEISFGFNHAVICKPLCLEKIYHKYKIESPIIYNEPFVDKSYIWKYSVQFNC